MRRVHAVALAIVLAVLAAMPSASIAEVSFNVFYSNLSPHGSWMVSAEYGRVWQPDVYRPGWNPYYDGHWAYSDMGWTWVSDYAWGGMPYHYGTWVLDPYQGWVWVPGYVWAPAWVVFSSDPDYIGWAPVPPNWSLSVSFGPRDIDPGHFVFVSAGHFLSPHVRGYAVSPHRTTTIIHRTKIVNNITVRNNVVINRGPDVMFVEKACRRKVRAVPIERVERAGPGPRFSREEIRFDPRRSREHLRAAEPVPERTPLPVAYRDNTRQERMTTRGNPHEGRPTSRGNPREAGMTSPGNPYEGRPTSRGNPHDGRMSSPGNPEDSRTTTPGNPEDARTTTPGNPREGRMGPPADRRGNRWDNSAGRGPDQAGMSPVTPDDDAGRPGEARRAPHRPEAANDSSMPPHGRGRGVSPREPAPAPAPAPAPPSAGPAQKKKAQKKDPKAEKPRDGQ